MSALFNVITDWDFLFKFFCNDASNPLQVAFQNLQICNISKYRKQLTEIVENTL